MQNIAVNVGSLFYGKVGEVGMDWCCKNCGWSEEIVGSPIMCNYSGHRTWRDECCEAWKPKNTTDDYDMVKVVRCKECNNRECDGRAGTIVCGITGFSHSRLWYCADGERKEGW